MKSCSQVSPHHHRQVPGTEWLERVITLLRRDKHRISEARMQVLVWVADREAAFTAEEIVTDLGTCWDLAVAPQSIVCCSSFERTTC